MGRPVLRSGYRVSLCQRLRDAVGIDDGGYPGRKAKNKRGSGESALRNPLHELPWPRPEGRGQLSIAPPRTPRLCPVYTAPGDGEADDAVVRGPGQRTT